MKYKVWNRTDNVIVPTGKVYTAEEWIAKHPIAGLEDVKVIMSGGTINGAMLLEFNQTIEDYIHRGADFSQCVTDEDYCEVMEEFDNRPVEPPIDVIERIASALEAQVMLSMEDI